ncbi:IclR family transcriptional regulator [Evansella tamaricis]|uniref:IclR family transcriptional regulator n=1 Tax=Evansella tamaricis TaxID=2069301 RepID=A0ABS6JDZ8_9BACI|nr:IclR family transcriptional regulator [Evansella tamaricis]MBU9711630.1 IclR family transcriptional regulator [Evansella tamaricis]
MQNVQSVERTLTILNVLSKYPNGIQLTKLAEKVNLTKSTTHRLLSTLHNMNYVVKDEESEKYKLGFQLVYLSRNLLDNLDIIHISKPFLEELSNDVSETIHLCVEDQEEVLYVDKIESNQTIRMYSQIGRRRPLYCSGVGKIILADMELKRFRDVVSRIKFEAKTANTITTVEGLVKEIDTVKKQGYALDNVEVEEGVRCIAGPIYNSRGKVVASFSISGPSNRITIERIEKELKEKVHRTSLAISRQLGY